MGVSTDNVSETQESVFGLCDIATSLKKPSARERIMGISVYTSQKRSYDENEVYLDSLSMIVDYAADCGYVVRFFPMELTGADRPCIEGVIERSNNKAVCSIVEDFPDTVEHMTEVSKCRINPDNWKTNKIYYASGF